MRLVVAQPSVILHGAGAAVACGMDGMLGPDRRHGLFCFDTRLLSGYRLTLGGVPLELLSRTREGHGVGHWHYQNYALDAADGPIGPGTVLVVLRRRVDGALHDDLQVTSFAARPLHIELALDVGTDFADIFEVKQHVDALENGGEPWTGPLEERYIEREHTPRGISFRYHRDKVERSLDLILRPCRPRSVEPPPEVGGRLVFDIALDHGDTWSCCLDAVPGIQGDSRHFHGDPHSTEAARPPPLGLQGDRCITEPFRQSCADLDSLTMSIGSGTFVAAGVPWFLTLFGRDTLTTSLMTGLVGTDTSRGTLATLARYQAASVDDWRDAEPGKVPHELRRGELAQRGTIPHTPYYGSHDTQALYCLALWNAWRWTGDQRLLDTHLPTARAALAWCDQHGDRDGDGLQEYETRSRAGYYNQSWKDAGDAVVTAGGDIAPLPLATVELQGYLYAARLAMAELFDAVGEPGEAAEQVRAAAALQALVEERFFWDDERFYVLALDGTKAQVRSVTSNPGHLLWCGLPTPDRAALVARRLVEPDLDSGWGLRTLSAAHPAYNPLSYQRGSVWPHDTALAAAGMARYGHRTEAGTLLRGLLDAAQVFESSRLPELFAGLPRLPGTVPVPYDEANTPQAWAAAASVLATQILLGLVPDAPSNRCFLDPWLPAWLTHLELDGIRVGGGRLRVRLDNRNGATTVDVDASAGLDVIRAVPPAPLWGTPPATPSPAPPVPARRF